jgi:hypothetical protein
MEHRYHHGDVHAPVTINDGSAFAIPAIFLMREYYAVHARDAEDCPTGAGG